MDFVVGTFSKSLGGVGGFCASRHADLELLRLGSRPYIFTASPAPAVIAAMREALRRVLDGAQLRKRPRWARRVSKPPLARWGRALQPNRPP